jgi:hypothetical protein
MCCPAELVLIASQKDRGQVDMCCPAEFVLIVSQKARGQDKTLQTGNTQAECGVGDKLSLASRYFISHVFCAESPAEMPETTCM